MSNIERYPKCNKMVLNFSEFPPLYKICSPIEQEQKIQNQNFFAISNGFLTALN